MSQMTTSEGKWLLQFTGVTDSVSTHILATTNTFIDKDIRITAIANSGNYSAGVKSGDTVNGTVLPSIGLTTNAGTNYQINTTTPTSGTEGVDYIIITPNASVTTDWSVTPRASITTAGYLATGSKDGTAITGTPTISTASKYYIPIVDITATGGDLTPTNFTKDDLAVTLAAGTTAANRNMTNYYVGAKNTSTYPYFFEMVGSTPAVTGSTSVTRAAVTYSNDAGVIGAHNGDTALSSTSTTASVSVNSATGNTYFSLKAAAASISASTAAPSIEKITDNVSGKTQILNTVTLINSNPANSIDTYYIAVKGFSGAVTQGTPSVSTEGYLKQSSQISASGVAAKNASAIYYLPVPTATFATSGSTVYCSAAGYVPQGSASSGIGTISSGTISAVASDPGNSYTENDEVILASGGWLQMTAGYYPATKISLATLVPDTATKPSGVSNYSAGLRVGFSLFDENGTLVTGSIPTYNGSYDLT